MIVNLTRYCYCTISRPISLKYTYINTAEAAMGDGVDVFPGAVSNPQLFDDFCSLAGFTVSLFSMI